VRQRNGSKWFGATGRHRNHSRSREARQIQICRWRVRDVQCLSREIADVARVTEKIGGARVVDAVSAANHGAAGKPWQGVTETKGWSKIVPVITPEQLVRIGRMLSNKLGCGQCRRCAAAI